MGKRKVEEQLLIARTEAQQARQVRLRCSHRSIAHATRAGGGVERIFRRLALGGRFWSEGGFEKLMCVSHNRLLTKRDKLRVSFIIVF